MATQTQTLSMPEHDPAKKIQQLRELCARDRAARARKYFFMPSLSALRWIGNLAETHSIEQKER